MNRIDSVSNDKIKLACKIASSAKKRRIERMFFLEGLRLCRDAVFSGVEIVYSFFGENTFAKFQSDVELISAHAQKSFIISQNVESKLALTQTAQGFYCLCRMKSESDIEIERGKKYIALENVQDPANLGAIIRTAEALGIAGAIVFNGCDIYSPKAQRSAMGSLFRLPVIECTDLLTLLDSCKEKGMKIYATTPDSSAQSITRIDMKSGSVCVIGNEGNGVSDSVFEICDKITIPMLGRAESLNASMAAAITMWEMMRCEEVENE